MGASKKLFEKQREIFMQDIREAGNYPPFDHEFNFKSKVKENNLSNEDFASLKNASLYELTQALIYKKMDDEYMTELMKLIDEKEIIEGVSYITGSRGRIYFDLVLKTPLENMKRFYEKYDNIDYYIKSDWRFDLGTEIMKKERLSHG